MLHTPFGLSVAMTGPNAGGPIVRTRRRSADLSSFSSTVMGTPGPLELILIFAVVLLIFGAKRIPEIARGIGKGIREFKDATSEISQELEAESKQRQINQPDSPKQGAPQARQSQKQPAPPDAEEPESTAEAKTEGSTPPREHSGED